MTIAIPLMRGPHVLPLLSGGHFDFARPEDSVYGIRDIATGLAKILRFAGQTIWPYSVAQHSVILSRIVPRHLAAYALLHDGPEFAMGDLVRPLKGLLPGYKDLEEKVLADMLRRFGLEPELPAEIVVADKELAALESRLLRPWLYDGAPPVGPGLFHGSIHAVPWWPTEVAIEEYLHRWEEVGFQRDIKFKNLHLGA